MSFNERYRQWLEANGGAVEGRRRLVEYARAHGKEAAARVSGACRSTIYELVRKEKSGRPWEKVGWSPLTREDEARIVAARREHPDYGPRRLKRLSGLPYGERQIWAVLARHDLMERKDWVKYPNPARMAVVWERRIEYARLELEMERHVAMFALRLFKEGKLPAVMPRLVRAFRRLEEAERKTAFWRRRSRTAADHGSPDHSPARAADRPM